jgi:Ser/Thr protein kinase RdoA (MazF antagonist)
MNAEITHAALTYYDLPNAQLTFLGRSQNTTFRVDTPTGDRFLLRLHVGIEATDGGSHDLWREASVIESELLWLNAIACDTELVVPQPVQNRLGQWVTSLDSETLGLSISCSLLRWVKGEHLDGEPTPPTSLQTGCTDGATTSTQCRFHNPMAK